MRVLCIPFCFFPVESHGENQPSFRYYKDIPGIIPPPHESRVSFFFLILFEALSLGILDFLFEKSLRYFPSKAASIGLTS